MVEAPKPNQVGVLYVVPSQEPVIMRDPLTERRHTLYEYLYNIGEEQRFEEVAPHLLERPEAHYGRTGYTSKQRVWIKTKRDESLDLAPYPHLTPDTIKLYSVYMSEPFERHLHHIWAQAYLQAYLGLADFPELINHPHNGITLSKIAHVGPYIPNVNHSRHPDVHNAKQNYRNMPDIMRLVFEDHWKLALDGVKYWVNDNDEQMFKIARERTERMRKLREERLKK